MSRCRRLTKNRVEKKVKGVVDERIICAKINCPEPA
jgi:hypothetical protein